MLLYNINVYFQSTNTELPSLWSRRFLRKQGQTLICAELNRADRLLINWSEQLWPGHTHQWPLVNLSAEIRYHFRFIKLSGAVQSPAASLHHPTPTPATCRGITLAEEKYLKGTAVCSFMQKCLCRLVKTSDSLLNRPIICSALWGSLSDRDPHPYPHWYKKINHWSLFAVLKKKAFTVLSDKQILIPEFKTGTSIAFIYIHRLTLDSHWIDFPVLLYW